MNIFNELFGKKKYVSVQYDLPSQLKLRQWCIDNGFDLRTKFDGTLQPIEKFDFHTTIFFSSSKHIMKNQTINFSQFPGQANIIGTKNLGKDPLKPIPVLLVDSPGIYQIRKDFETLWNMKDPWPEFIPHVSISYNGIGSTPIERIKKLPDFPLYFDKLIIDDAKEF